MTIATISKLIFEYDTIILGSSLDALIMGAQKKSPVFFSDFEIPHRFDYFDADANLDYLKLPHDVRQKTLTTPDGEIVVGVPKHVVWERLMLLLSMSGYAPLSNLCTNIRIDNNVLYCFNDYAKIAEIRFNNCIYYGDKNISLDLFKKSSTSHSYICYDWIAFNKGGKHDIDYFQTDDDFVKRVWFYSSDRIDGNTAVKDACVVSTLSEEQLYDFDYSETTSRFKLVYEMEKRGMKGLFNGYGANGKPKYYKFKTTHIRREKHSKGQIEPAGVSGVQIAPTKPKTLLKNLPQIYMEYNRLLGSPFE